jgi:hypothetical protein
MQAEKDRREILEEDSLEQGSKKNSLTKEGIANLLRPSLFYRNVMMGCRTRPRDQNS